MSDPTLESVSADGKVLGLLADPGTPAEIAGKVAGDLAEASGDHGEHSRRWEVSTHVQVLPGVSDGYDELVAVARRCIEQERWDGVLCLTDNPLRDGQYALVAELLRDYRVALLSLPAFGALPLRRHVGAVAADYVLINSSTWQFADQISTLKLTLLMLFSIASMVTWLVVDHRLWERPSEDSQRRRIRLFNASTVVTLLIGIACAYAVLYAVNLIGEAFLIDPGFLETTLGHPARITDYLSIAWFATSVSLVAGAVGSGFEDEQSVRKAAYSQRERERHEQAEKDSDDRATQTP